MRRLAGSIALCAVMLSSWSAEAQTQRCEIPREARDIWRCERGFVIGPENVIIRLPIPETDPEALYNAGIEAAGREDWRVAIAYFTAAHQRAHLVPRYMYNLGLAHARAGHDAVAVAYLAAYLSADPRAPNRSAIWAQIAQMEARARREADALWQSAERAADAFARADGMSRMGVYSDLARIAAEAGEDARVITFARLMVRASYEDGHLDEAAAQQEASNLLFAAAGAAYDDYDVPSIERITAMMPEDRRSLSDGLLYNLRHAGVRPRLPVDWPLYVAGFSYGPTERLSAMAVSGQTSELFGVLRRFHNGDWSADGFDAELRQDDAQMTNYGGDWLRTDRGSDNLWRYRQGEIIAAKSGETYLIRGDLPHATSAAQIARSIVARGIRAAPNINGDLAQPNYSPNAASLLGWYSIRLDALILAERADIEGALALLNDFLAHRSVPISRYTPSPQSEGTFAFETGLPWVEARYLSLYTIAEFLARRGRLDEAVQLSERLDAMRSEQLHAAIRQMFPAAATGAPSANALASAGLVDLITSARTMAGAAYDLPAWLARVQSTSDPNEQMRLLSGGASDIQRGLRRTHALYASASGTWGQ